MVLRIRSLAFILFMIVLLSSVVSGHRPNLILGGIWQTPYDQATNQEYAELLDAEYVPTYYSLNGGIADVIDLVGKAKDVAAVTDATPQMTVYKDSSTGAIVPVPGTAIYRPTDLNGLTSDLLSQGPSNPSDHYDNIYAHSGGARTAVTALLYQHVTADTLVLLSPAMGPMDRELYLWEIQQLLDLGFVKEIVVYQSAVDTPFLGEFWQGKFNPDDITNDNFKIIYLNKKQLCGQTGTNAHIQMWATVLNLELGRDPCLDLQEEQEQSLTWFDKTKAWFSKYMDNLSSSFGRTRHSDLELESISVRKTCEILDGYRSLLLGYGSTFSYSVVDAKSFDKKEDCARYMNDRGITYEGTLEALNIIDVYGLESSRFCLVIVEYNLMLLGENLRILDCVVCDDKGEPIGYRAFQEFMQGYL